MSYLGVRWDIFKREIDRLTELLRQSLPEGVARKDISLRLTDHSLIAAVELVDGTKREAAVDINPEHVSHEVVNKLLKGIESCFRAEFLRTPRMIDMKERERPIDLGALRRIEPYPGSIKEAKP